MFGYGASPFSYGGGEVVEMPTHTPAGKSLLEPSRPDTSFVQYKAFDIGFMLAQGQQGLSGGPPLAPGPQIEAMYQLPPDEKKAMAVMQAVAAQDKKDERRRRREAKKEARKDSERPRKKSA